MPADLHIHSNCSDGLDPPETIVGLARAAGLTAISLTDHDTVDGIDGAVAAGQQAGVEVIPGIEFTTEQPRAEIHILGYFIDHRAAGLRSILEKIQADRVKRIYKIVRKLQSLKVDILPEDVFAVSGKKAPGRPHVARALLKLGAVSSFKEAFNRYLDFRSPAYVSHYKLAPAEAVRLVRTVGGLPVFAHPAVSNCDELIPGLVAEGLRGIEVYYPGLGPEAIERYLGLARQYGLLVTGGSDWHGNDPGREVKLGDLTIPDELVERMKDEHLHGNKSGSDQA